jgi:hypothetical protein
MELCDSCAQRAPALPPQQRFPADRHQLLCATEPACRAGREHRHDEIRPQGTAPE